MPTGSGKSICYQLPGIIFEGLTIVISPLISLMKDQVNLLKTNDIDSAYINSSLSYSKYNSVINGINEGKYKIVYVAPERLESDDFLEIIQENNVSMVAVDEAHCVSQWGHDFRPSYLKIKNFISKIKGNPIISAFTATATENVEKDIVEQLGLKNHTVVSTGYDRKNLYFEVRKTKDKFTELLKILSLEKGNSGIIYCTTLKSVEKVCNKLINEGYSATRYHAGLNVTEREYNQETFILDEKLIMVATNAFGMGIDKSNVNFVIHYNMPKNLENYYQEAGRAGRDGSPAKCILLYSYQDVVINKFLIEKTIESENYIDSKLKEKVIKKNYGLLNKMQEYCTTRGCCRQYMLNYFGDSGNNYCKNCYNCIGDFEVVDIQYESYHIISAIKYFETNGKSFGKRMVVDVLKGSNTKKIKNLSFDKIPSFNKLNHKNKEEIALIMDFLVDKKYLRIFGAKYPVIKLWKNYGDILNGLVPLTMKISKDELSIFKEKAPLSKEKTHEVENQTKQTPDKDISLNKLNKSLISQDNPIDNVLFEKLRKLRLKLAREEKIPPFMVFHDSTLKDMCKKFPCSENEFLEVSGVGKVKMEKYGDFFINQIKKKFKDSEKTGKEDLKTKLQKQTENKETSQFDSTEHDLSNTYHSQSTITKENNIPNKEGYLMDNDLMIKIKNFVLENESKKIENPFYLTCANLLAKKSELLSSLKEGDKYLLAINSQINKEDIRIMELFNSLPNNEKNHHGKNQDTRNAFKEFNISSEIKIIKEKQKYIDFVMNYIKEEINLIDQTLNIKLELSNSKENY